MHLILHTRNSDVLNAAAAAAAAGDKEPEGPERWRRLRMEGDGRGLAAG